MYSVLNSRALSIYSFDIHSSHLLVYICIYIYIYIYAYIFCHPHTDCFVVSQLFSVARHVGRLKLETKLAQHYVRLSIRPLSQQAYYVGKGIIRYYVATAAAFVCLYSVPYRIPECSIRSKSFTLCERQPKIPSPECSTPMGERIYIFIYRQSVSLYHNSSVCLDTWDASNWDRNPAKFTLA